MDCPLCTVCVQCVQNLYITVHLLVIFTLKSEHMYYRPPWIAPCEKVRHRGIGDESRLRAVYANLESNSEPERARVCQRVAVRASESQSMPESGSESQ